MSYDKLFKLILIGDSGVGKKTLRQRYGFEITEDSIEPPNGVVCYGKDVELYEVGICRIHIWELGLDKKIRDILPKCLEGANGVIFLFDIARISTLTLIDKWLDLLHSNDPDIPIMIVGNKIDIDDRRDIGRLEPFEFAHDRFCKAYIELSAKTGKKVEVTFHVMTQIMWDYYKFKNSKK